MRYFPGMKSTQRSSKGEGFRFSLPLGNPPPFKNDQSGGLRPPYWMYPRGDHRPPNLCRFSAHLPRLVGIRRRTSNAVGPQNSTVPGPKARYNRADHPGFVRRIGQKEFGSAAPITGARGWTAWRTRRSCRRSPIVSTPGGVLVTLPPRAK